MLKGVDPLLNADVLYILRAMGHGDTLVISDTNFPSDSIAMQCAAETLGRIDNVPAARAVEAVMSVLPVEAVARMEVMGAPDEIPAAQAEVQAVVDRFEPQLGKMGSIERFAFYEEAKKAYAVITTGERRFYGCFILTKGVVPPDA
ncbi:MAG: RbsD/FucU domain-containing protein [Pseudomonadota bacterium]